jgi:hypothetical protein
MESEQKLAVLQNVYAAAIAETVNTYQVLGFLAAIEQRKQERQEQTAPYMLAQLGISTVEDVFSRLSSIFGCANWNVEYEESGYRAVATTCKLCALSKRMGGASPCKGWCIDPMVAMIKALENKANVTVESTLMNGSSCSLKVKLG